MRETSSLLQFMHLEKEHRVLQQDRYVDDILSSDNDLKLLKATATNVERVLEAGCFLKPWVFSGQSGRQGVQDELEDRARSKAGVMVLPNQMSDNNKALGLGYVVEEDKLHVTSSINFSKRKKKMQLGQNLHQDEVGHQRKKSFTKGC